MTYYVALAFKSGNAEIAVFDGFATLLTSPLIAGSTSRPSTSSTRMATARKRKKDGAYTFARLSLASARHLVADAMGRLAGNRKKDRGPAEGRRRARGTDTLSPTPKVLKAGRRRSHEKSPSRNTY
jgi:hypothetical protein